MKDTKDYQDALALATEIHRHQVRADGTPYINHPIRVDDILIELGRPIEEVIAGLLHDTIEDTEGDDAKKLLEIEIDLRFGSAVLSIIQHSMKISKKEDGNRSVRVKIDFHHYMTGNFQNHNVKVADVVANLEEGHSLPDDFRPRWVREKRMFIEGLEKMYGQYEGSDFQKVLIDRAKVLINRLL